MAAVRDLDLRPVTESRSVHLRKSRARGVDLAKLGVRASGQPRIETNQAVGGAAAHGRGAHKEICAGTHNGGNVNRLRAELSVRRAVLSDAAAIGVLHAESWRRHYRGAYSDAYLDGELDTDRLLVWTKRLTHGGDDTFTLIAKHENKTAGFIHVDLDGDPTWGALVDNLHVGHELQGAGIGTQLLKVAARMVIAGRPGSGLYLWVQEQNTRAQAFYLSRGGTPMGREAVSPPRGDPGNLAGSPQKIRIVWSESAVLSRFGPDIQPGRRRRLSISHR